MKHSDQYKKEKCLGHKIFIKVKNFIVRKVFKNVSEETKVYIKKSFFVNYKNQYVEIKRLLSEIGINKPILIDGGAHEGQTISKFKKYFPEPEIYAFEAIPELAIKLKNNENINVTIFNKAIGERDEKIEFKINNSTATSSALDSDLAYKYYPGQNDLIKKISIDCVSLDSLLNDNIIKQSDVIKLDLQGYELFALNGAKQTLANAKIVLTEVEFISLYKDQPLFEDIAQFMKDNNYRLYNFYDIQNDKSGQIIFADAIFINNNFFKQ